MINNWKHYSQFRNGHNKLQLWDSQNRVKMRHYSSIGICDLAEWHEGWEQNPCPNAEWPIKKK
jgi:hypothetical protein